MPKSKDVIYQFLGDHYYCFPPRMHRKNGQFASLKESSGTSGWDSSQSGVQDGTSRQETV